MRRWLGNQRAGATLAALSALVAAGALAGCGARSHDAGAPMQRAVPAAASSPAAGASLPAQQVSGSPATGSIQPPVGAGQVGTLAQLPWGSIGPGWALADYTTGSHNSAAPVTLYAIDPEGGMYQLYRWPATTDPWQLVSWSGDKSRVLLIQPAMGPLILHQLTIATGQVTTFRLPADVTNVLGYTRPNGENILVGENGIVRYSLTGVFQARLSAGSQFDSAISATDGRTEVVSGHDFVSVVSNSGRLIRSLPVPGASAADGACRPVRWWTPADALVSCTMTAGAGAPQVWLVPVSGAAPTALTHVRAGGGPDMGDIDAWQLPSGLYVQALAGCGPPFIARQSAGGAVQVVTVPGSYGNGLVVATSGNRLLVQEFSECFPGSTLVWFNPDTSGVQRVLAALKNSTGVQSAIPFNGDGEQPPPQA